jgi:hypothetical protein
MNSSPITTAGVGLSGAMLAGVIVWICSIARIPAPPTDVAATMGALLLAGAHMLGVWIARRQAAPTSPAPVAAPKAP